MSYYVDGFVVPVPKDNLEAYRAMARTASEVWKEHGALAYWEGAADRMATRVPAYFRYSSTDRPHLPPCSSQASRYRAAA